MKIRKRDSPPELIQSMLGPSAKIGKSCVTYSFALADSRDSSPDVKSEGARAVLVQEASGAQRTLQRRKIENRRGRSLGRCPKASNRACRSNSRLSLPLTSDHYNR